MTPAQISLAISLGCMLQARTLVVGPTGEFTSVAAAVHAAVDADSIEVHPGTYSGNIVLDRPVSLRGTGLPVLRGQGDGSVITVIAPGCSIRGFRIEHSGAMLVDENSGILLRSDGNRVEDNQLDDVLFGIYFYRSSHNTVAGNTLRGRRLLGFGERGAGIHIWNSVDNTILRNTITDMRDGMYLQNADRSTIRGNHVFDVRYGLHYMYSNENIFEDNVFDNNVAGAAIMYSHDIQFRRNTFRHNRGFSSFGVLFQDAQNCLAERNLFVDNVVGIFMEALRDSRFEQNLVASNDTAIEVFSSAERNEFTRNNFVDNLSPIRIVGKTSNIRWDRGGAGNYWSAYTGYDLDGNGIGDVPFHIQNLFEHLEGNRPRLRIYFFSAASQALAAAEQSFPVIEGSKEFDRYPLMKPVTFEMTKAAEADPQPRSVLLAGIPVAMFLTAAFVMWRAANRGASPRSDAVTDAVLVPRWPAEESGESRQPQASPQSDAVTDTAPVPYQPAMESVESRQTVRQAAVG